ncbi:hypothetical protein T4D_13921 [Trichinella pseudospiralis]|uniref:Uncharacterized protein n=1 Tax=Trichinella pseudospiralis TaxID=6337 RepID=A0A0V1DRX5_TRIPS|nr:hypothetical protein T4D_13921 [Trichinella pseudospiralis]
MALLKFLSAFWDIFLPHDALLRATAYRLLRS